MYSVVLLTYNMISSSDQYIDQAIIDTLEGKDMAYRNMLRVLKSAMTYAKNHKDLDSLNDAIDFVDMELNRE